MPRLPDKDALGGIPSLNSGRQGVSASEAKEDVSGQQATSMALAKGFETLAGGVQRIAEEEIRQEDALDLIRANNQHTQRLNDINNQFDTDNDWRTYRPRFADSATSATAEAGAGIRNAALRDRWIEQVGFVSNAEMLIKARVFKPKCDSVGMYYRYGVKAGGSKLKVWKTISGYFEFFRQLRRTRASIAGKPLPPSQLKSK